MSHCEASSTESGSPYIRNLVERFFNKIKQWRWVATRYNKPAANCLAFVRLASIRLCLGVNEATPQFALRSANRRRFRRGRLGASDKSLANS
jgi:hypothetical protein